MDKGKVKNIHDRGFGFISSDALNTDVFCPPDIVQNENLVEGDYVEFDYEKASKGPKVVQLNKIDAPVNPLFEKALKIDQLDAKQYDIFIEELKSYVNNPDFKKNITTSKIRSIFSYIQNAKTTKDIKMLRPKLAYQAGRDNKTKFFMNDLDKMVKQISDTNQLDSFKQFFEAIVCYKKEIEN